MIIEPFELKGKTIEDSHFIAAYRRNGILVIEFTDGTTIQVEQIFEDESGRPCPSGGILISKQ